MKNFLKKAISPLYYLIIEKYAYDNNTSFFNKLMYTIRFKAAGKNMFLTDNEKRIKSLKDIHKGKRCFIIGNGPSLNLLDLTKLKDEFTFGVNAIYLNHENMGFYPTYYVVEDNLVAEDRAHEINEYHGSKLKFFGTYLSYLLKQDPETVYLNVLRNYADKKNFPVFSKDIVRKLCVGGTVTYLCLQLAYYMGFEEVYMIGFDHNYVIPKSAEISNKRETGFDIVSTEDDPNHFHPDYFGKGYRWHDPNVERMEVGFRKAREVYEADGRNIYNATAGGKLEAFKRIDYNTLF